MNKKLSAVACGAAALTLGLTGCGASFEGTGSKDAASAEQLALRTDDPWAAEVAADPAARSAEPLRDGLYTGSAPAMAGNVGVTLLVQDGRISCVSLAGRRNPKRRRFRSHPRREVRADDRGGRKGV